MAATLQTALTPLGWQTLIRSGLEDEIVFYKIDDYTHNYLVTEGEVIVPPVVGSHSVITTSECAFANYSGVYATKPVREEVKNVLSKVQYSFINEDCSYGDFDVPNLTLNIYVDRWLQQLASATYSFNMTESLSTDLWDYVTATVKTLNLTTKTYTDVSYITNMGINYRFKTDFDRQNFEKLSPVVVTIEQGNQKKVVDKSNIKFGSPFGVLFSTYPVNGFNTVGTAGRFIMKPNKFGYWVNKSSFLTTTEVETSDLSRFTTVNPAAIVGSNIYYLPSNTTYQTKNGLIGYAMHMVNVNGNGETMLTGLINQAKLFFKYYGIFDSLNNYYTLPINMEVMGTNQEINYITNKIGGNIKLNFIYNPNNTTTGNIIELIQ